jgi:hypothetical protein
MKISELFEGDVVDFNQKIFDLKNKPVFSTDPRTLRQNRDIQRRATEKAETLASIEDKKIQQSMAKAKGYIHDFFMAYMEAALWSSTDQNTDEPLDKRYSISSISSETMDKMLQYCQNFILKTGDLLEDIPAESAGHDFWLTQNRHGAGFFDRDYPKDIKDKLTELAHTFPEVDLYVGDSGYLYA